MKLLRLLIVEDLIGLDMLMIVLGVTSSEWWGRLIAGFMTVIVVGKVWARCR